MNRRIFAFALAAFALLLGTAFAAAQTGGTAAEAKAMLEKAIAALKADETAALAAFNNPTAGFRDRDLYVFCYNMTTGAFTAHLNPALIGKDVRTIKAGDDPLGQRIFDIIKGSAPGSIVTVDYSFPKPGTTRPVPKESFVTRVANQGCGVGYYK